MSELTAVQTAALVGIAFLFGAIPITVGWYQARRGRRSEGGADDGE